MNTLNNKIKACPVAIGGVGGSGTRVIASIMDGMGVFIGNNLNKSNDNLSFPKFGQFILASTKSDELKEHDADHAIKCFKNELTRQFMHTQAQYLTWGWKAPTTFYWLNYFSRHLPDMVYIHVIRHGLDMAFSNNRNQLNARAKFFNIDLAALSPAQAAVEYWIKANTLAKEKGKMYLQNRFYLFNFDQLCLDPVNEINLLADFLAINISHSKRHQLTNLITPPTTLGHYKTLSNKNTFSPQQIDAVIKMGFPV